MDSLVINRCDFSYFNSDTLICKLLAIPGWLNGESDIMRLAAPNFFMEK